MNSTNDSTQPAKMLNETSLMNDMTVSSIAWIARPDRRVVRRYVNCRHRVNDLDRHKLDVARRLVYLTKEALSVGSDDFAIVVDDVELRLRNLILHSAARALQIPCPLLLVYEA